jgi:PilZ domain
VPGARIHTEKVSLRRSNDTRNIVENLKSDSKPPGTGEKLMEHRLFRRFPSDLPVDIYQGHRCIVQGRARNVSREGALLEADAGPLPGHGQLQLELKAADAGVAPRRLRGVVVHREDQRVGVMFLDAWSDSEWRALTACDATPAHAVAAGRSRS